MERDVKRKRNWSLFPLEIILCVLPLILGFYIGNSGYGIYPWNAEDDVYTDVFLYYKMIVFIIISATVLLLVVWKLAKMDKTIRKKSLLVFLPLFVYLVFVILSTIASKNITYSLFGSMGQNEPFPVLAGYVIVTFYAYLVVNTEEDVKQLTASALVGAFIMAVLGILQAIGKDPLTLEFVQRLFVDVDTYGVLQLRFPVGQAYGTLYNPNYVGSYVALYFPLMLVGFLISKVLWKKVVYIATAFGLLFFLFASQSRTGLISIVMIVFMFFLFKSQEVVKRWYVVIPGVTFVVLAFLLVDAYRDNLLTNRLKQMFEIEKSLNDLQGVDTTGNGVRFVYKDTEFTVMMAVSATDFAYAVYEGDEQKEVSYEEYKREAYFTLNNGETITIQTVVFAEFNDVLGFGLHFDGQDYYFTNQIVKGNYKYVNIYGRADECVMIDTALQGYEAVASGRGYVFGRSIPLLSKYFVIGSGPDTFGIVFPQNDYVGRAKTLLGSFVYTRPHNLYLQMGIQTGVISLIAFLVFYARYFASCCRRYFFKKFTRIEQWLGFAIFLATTGFMAAGLANDSLVVVSPVFYVLLGTGMAVNHKVCLVKHKEIEETDEMKEIEEVKEIEETKEVEEVATEVVE